MSKLLSGNTFDPFLLAEATLRMSVLWQTDGHLNKAFYSEEEWNDPSVRPYDLAQWEEVRPYLRELIKGRRAPSAFQFVLHLKPELMKSLLERAQQGGSEEAVSAMGLSVRFDGSHMQLVTGVSLRTFTQDRSAEKLWDEAVQRFLIRKEISFEPL